MTSPADARAADERPAWVRIGVVARPHGVRGGLKLHLDNPDSEVLRAGLPVRLGDEERTVARVYGTALVDLDGVSGRDAADALRGREVLVRREDFPPPSEDEAYLVDLLGARVLHDDDGRQLGVIEGFSDNGAQPLAEVRTPAGQVRLMPFVPGIVTHVDEDERVVKVAPPEGLLEGEPLEAAPEDKRPKKKAPS
jgi:16S rRNA processing protein RimM